MIIGSLILTPVGEQWQASLRIDNADVHASPVCMTRERAREHIRRYAKKNSITIAYGD